MNVELADLMTQSWDQTRASPVFSGLPPPSPADLVQLGCQLKGHIAEVVEVFCLDLEGGGQGHCRAKIHVDAWEARPGLTTRIYSGLYL